MIPFQELTFNNYNSSPENQRMKEASEKFFNKFSFLVNLLGPVLSFSLVLFFLILVYTLHTDIIPFWENHIGMYYGMCMRLISFFFAFSWSFNYTLSLIMKGGYTSDLKNSRFYRNNDPLEISTDIVDLKLIWNNKTNNLLKEGKVNSMKNDNFILKNFNNTHEISILNENSSQDNFSHNFSHIKSTDDEISGSLNENSEKNTLKQCSPETNIPVKDINIFSLESIYLPVCKYCKTIKPLRSHHCSVCRKCVMKMDHHCPWVNNCIGHYNHRYFINLLTFQLLYSGLTALLSIPIYFISMRNNSIQFKFVSVLSFMCTCSTLFLFIVNWYLLLRGNTLIEFLTILTNRNEDKTIKDFSLGNWRDNLFVVYGTRSMLIAICCCSTKRVPLSGLEWTKLVYPDFKFSDMYLQEEIDLPPIKLKYDIFHY
jgi:hypothetical protein